MRPLTARLERYWPSAPLRTYLVAVILLATLPLAALMSFQIFMEVRGQQAQIEDNLQRSATALSQAVESELIASLDALTVLSHADVLRQRQPAQLERLLMGRPRPRRDWHSVFLLDREGALLIDTAGAASVRAQFGDLQDLHQRVRHTLQPVVSGLLDTMPPAQAVMLAVPVVQGGQLRYVLGARIGHGVWQRLASSASRPEGGHAVLHDGQHRLISYAPAAQIPAGARVPPDAIEAMQAKPAGVARTSGIDGRSVYTAWHSVPVAGWSVHVGLPASPIDAAHRKAIITALSVSGAGLLLGVLLAALAASRIARPLRQLATQGPGGLRGRVPVKEIALLRDALRTAEHQDAAARSGLEAKAQEFQTLFDSSPIGMAFAQDPQCKLVLHNAEMDRLLGKRESIAAGAVQMRRAGVILPMGEFPLRRAALRGETVLAEELEITLPGQAPVFVLANAVPLRGAQGRPRGAISAMVDITQRKQAEARLLRADTELRESQRLMELAQQAGHVGFFHYRFAADELAWSPGQCKLFGIESLPGPGLAQWFDLIDENERARVEREFWTACALHRDNETLDYSVTWPDGSSHWLSTRVLLHYQPDGAAAQVTAVTVDMTDHREAEKQRAEITEREVAARQQAEAASRAKDEFLTMLSHELRNPLGAISAAIDVLDIAPAGSENAVEARGIIARQTRNLSHMMNDLLDVGRVLAGKIMLARQPVNLAAVLERVRSTLEVMGESARHELHLQAEDAWVDGDAVRLEQVMTHLLGNAIKYTPAGRRIEVRLTCQEGTAVFEVQDAGTGIPAALLPHIFDLFVQGERPLDRRAGGLGIGLTLVRRLVELHGGTIAAHSAETGSRFVVTLPAALPPSRPEGDTLPPSRRRKVLVIDDNADVLAALRAKLELDGHSVSTAADGVDGLNRLLRLQPEVSIVDIGLPGLTGYELARHARAAGYAGRMIALSGYSNERDVNNALVAGFDAYLVKPVDRGQLRASMSAE